MSGVQIFGLALSGAYGMALAVSALGIIFLRSKTISQEIINNNDGLIPILKRTLKGAFLCNNTVFERGIKIRILFSSIWVHGSSMCTFKAISFFPFYFYFFCLWASALTRNCPCSMMQGGDMAWAGPY